MIRQVWRGVALLAVLAIAPPVWSQQAPEPFRIGVLPIPPFAQLDPDGQANGFLVELAEEIAGELGTGITLVPLSTSREFVESQATGRTDMIAGIAQLPALRDTNVFSRSISRETLRPMVRIAQAQSLSTTSLSGRRVGIVPPAVGSEQQAFLARNTAVEFESPEAAIMALLSERVDAVLIPEPVAFNIAKLASVDGRVSFLNPPLRQFERFIALHQSRADLLPDIEAALDRIEGDRRLDNLLRKYFLDIPLPAPEVLRVGVRHAPPYQVIEPDGSFSGFGVETLRDLAGRTGLKLAFHSISDDDWRRGPQSDTYDILPAASITTERSARMDFAHPILATDQSVFTRPADAAELRRPEDLQGRRIGLRSDNAAAIALATANGWTIVAMAEARDLLAALQDRRIDAVIYQSDTLPLAAARWGDPESITEALPALLTTERAAALRFGLGEIRDKLDLALPQYLVSADYAELRRQYFEPAVFWTSDRLALLGYGLVGGVLGLLGILGTGQLRARRRTAAEKARQAAEVAEIRDELETVLNAATSGIVALDRDGQIIRINRRARRMLGGVSQPVPFAWPQDIYFLDSESNTPLEDSADPIRRARSGHVLTGETHLLRRHADSEDYRYVRVTSAVLDNEEHGISLVLVIDDISSEERNRLASERKNRLDALGQFTGGIAHDFNNLLASMLYAVELARSSETPDSRARFLNIAAGAIDKGRALTARLLAFAKRQPGLAMAKPVDEVFADFEELIGSMIEERIQLACDPVDPGLRVYCDPAQLETALMNLVLNSRDAILHSGRGDRITLTARAVLSTDDDLDADQRDHDNSAAPGSEPGIYRYVELSVTDNGPGMDEATVARCTDPFFTTKGSVAGTGLGLSMVYGFARNANGDLRIYSEPGIGTTVQMILPRGTEQGEREAPVSDGAAIRGNGETILLAEDEPELLSMMSGVLEELGYQVLATSSAQQALDLAGREASIDLLLTDVVMPGSISGFELARCIRALRPGVPVVYTSGYIGFTAAEMGPVEAPLLQKPSHPHDLAATVAAALGRGATA
ncbi:MULTISPECIES: transporter substrate-binding domain-containing protein [unclassified Phaeobacter]|uniref:transporter substrate-binding domain-containing protein n=1 Tax=unclassified Phaeobacter TaxID=2621772 RepID=UPI003A87B46A